MLATALNRAIDNDKNSNIKEKAKPGVNYYNYEHDILKNRIFYNDVFTTYTVAAVFGNLYIFEMDKNSRDIEQEFEDEYENFIPIVKVDSD